LTRSGLEPTISRTNESRWEAVVRFIDIGDIVDHHYLDFLFINYVNSNKKQDLPLE